MTKRIDAAISEQDANLLARGNPGVERRVEEAMRELAARGLSIDMTKDKALAQDPRRRPGESLADAFLRDAAIELSIIRASDYPTEEMIIRVTNVQAQLSAALAHLREETK